MDLIQAHGKGKDDVKSYCLALGPLDSNRFDCYYDLSSSRADHLELPVYVDTKIDGQDFPKKLLQDFLVGTPFSRDVVPPLESMPTEQRGGCMVIINRNCKSFEPLATQQHAPSIEFSKDLVFPSRRSDSFWCKEMKKRGTEISVNEQLFVYHDNRFDAVSSPSGIRQNIVQEVIGGVLCREKKWRKSYKDARLLDLHCWLSRVRGILLTIRNRPYCSDELVREFIEPLEEILDVSKWKDEVRKLTAIYASILFEGDLSSLTLLL